MGTLQTELIEKGLSDARTGEVDRKSSKAKCKSLKQMTDRDWAEIMGVNRDTFKRVRGSIRRR